MTWVLIIIVTTGTGNVFVSSVEGFQSANACAKAGNDTKRGSEGTEATVAWTCAALGTRAASGVITWDPLLIQPSKP